jgi:putative peptidoglycan lipid II flippase
MLPVTLRASFDVEPVELKTFTCPGQARMEERHIVKSAAGMSLMTFVSRVFGLMREWLRGYLLGTTGSSDAFALAFLFPNLLRRLVGEGALMAAFVPIISDYREHYSREELEDFTYSFFTLLLFILLGIVVIALLSAGVLRFFLPEFSKVEGKIELTIKLTRLMFPYILFISLAALSQAILNAHKVFMPSAATPILLNISIISFGLLASEIFSDPAYALGVGVLVGGIVQFFFQWPFLARYGIRFRFRFHFQGRGVKQVLRLMVPGAIGAGVYQINALVSQFIAAFLEEGSVAALRFSLTLIELVLGIFVISLTTVILPVLSEKSSKGDMDGMKESLRYALRLVFIITLPALFGLIILRYPLITMLFRYGRFTEESVDMVARALLYHAIGLVGIGGTRVVVQMFYSMKDTKTPVYVAMGVMVVNIALCLVLSGPLRLGGIALAGSASAYCNFFALLYLLERRIGRVVDRSVISCFLKSLIASLCMGGVLWFGLQRFQQFMALSRVYNALVTISLIVVGLFVFLLISILLRNRDVVDLMRAFRGRLGRRL